MATESMEKIIESMQNEIKSMKHEMERLQAVQEIQNLAAKYAFVHLPTISWQSVDLFALKQPDVSVEIAMWGKFVGAEKIRKMYGEMGGEQHEPRPGFFAEHQLTTPVIQVAADGKTAKGLWFSPGHETRPDENGNLVANWCWGKFGADFIKEDGKWKIWHYHFYDTFMAPYHKSWVETPQPALDIVWEHRAGLEPDSPPTSRSTYFPDQVRPVVPEYPEPYETWDGKSVA